MIDVVLAFDLGTGGCKASLWTADAVCVAEHSVPYATTHPKPGWNEQRPDDWWRAIVDATRALLAQAPAGVAVAGIAVSGQSLGALMVDARGEPVGDTTPIWSDTRAGAQADAYFARVPEGDWYEVTGNGFSPALYPLFKSMWFAEHRPEMWRRARHIIGSKDYVNLRLTGVIATDHSYASGSGAYDLRARGYDDDLLGAAGLDRRLLPEPVSSQDVLGGLTAEAGTALGLLAGTPVHAGAVDNACMALGSRGIENGRLYASLGSSSWITLTSAEPVVDRVARPFVFAHAVPGLYISALSTFSSGTTMEWIRDLVAPGEPMTDLLDEGWAAPLGANGLTLLPMLAGGTPLEGGSRARGAIHGLDLSHGRADVVRASMEGIAFALRRSLDLMGPWAGDDALLITGGGGRHQGWNQLYADVFARPLVTSAVGQQAAAYGAAIIALVGGGAWGDLGPSEAAHVPTAEYSPDPFRAAGYDAVREAFDEVLRTSPPVRGA